MPVQSLPQIASYDSSLDQRYSKKKEALNNSPYYKNQPRSIKQRIISPYGRGGSVAQLNVVGNNNQGSIMPNK